MFDPNEGHMEFLKKKMKEKKKKGYKMTEAEEMVYSEDDQFEKMGDLI